MEAAATCMEASIFPNKLVLDVSFHGSRWWKQMEYSMEVDGSCASMEVDGSRLKVLWKYIS